VLQWAIEYPDFIKAAIPIATSMHLNAQSIAFDAWAEMLLQQTRILQKANIREKKGLTAA